MMNRKIRIAIIIALFILTVGASHLIGPVIINPFHMDETTREILFSIRSPRVFVAVLMGMALGASGAVLQGILRNPLADPYILGISSGASLSAAIGIIAGEAFLGTFTIPAMAYGRALLTGSMVRILGWRHGGLWAERLLLAGVGLSFLFSALLMMIMSISRDEGMRRAMLWIFGDLSTSEWSRIPYGVAFVAAGLSLALSRSKALNALILGDEIAHSLGFSPRRERLVLFVAVGLMTAASVSLGGMIGFIGLLIPHMMRFLSGADSRLLVPMSALGGGILLCLADLVSRTLLPPMELPAGIITALIGSPYFLYMLRRKNVLSI